MQLKRRFHPLVISLQIAFSAVAADVSAGRLPCLMPSAPTERDALDRFCRETLAPAALTYRVAGWGTAEFQRRKLTLGALVRGFGLLIPDSKPFAALNSSFFGLPFPMGAKSEHVKRPPELEQVNILPGKAAEFGMLRTGLVDASNRTSANGVTDLLPIINTARIINTDFQTTLPLASLSQAGRGLADVLTTEILWQIFLPAGEMFRVVGVERKAEAYSVNVLHATWIEHHYLGTSVWSAELASHPVPDVAAARQVDRIESSKVFVAMAVGRLAFSNRRVAAEIMEGIMNGLNSEVHFSRWINPGGHYVIEELKTLVSIRKASSFLRNFPLGIAIPGYEELQHAKDFVFAELFWRKDLRFDFHMAGKMAAAIQKPDNPLSEIIRGHKTDDVDATIIELAGKLGSILEYMDTLIQQQEFSTAYEECLVWLYLMKEWSNELRASPTQKAAGYFRKLMSVMPYQDFNGLVRQINPKAGARSVHEVWGLPPQEFKPYALSARDLLGQLYAANFWSTAERQQLLDSRSGKNSAASIGARHPGEASPSEVKDSNERRGVEYPSPFHHPSRPFSA